MDPRIEQRLRNEVLYLHSLWHQGHHSPQPPTLNPNPNLQPSNSTHFKNPKRRIPKSDRRKHKSRNFSGKEWPVPPPSAVPPVTPSGWPELKLNPQTTRLPTPEEVERYNWNQIQKMAIEAAKEFYSNNREKRNEDDDNNDDSDGSDGSDGSDENVGDDGNNVDGKDFEFWWKVFEGNEELKGYYAKHCGGGGEFSCLVCGGANEHRGKKFKHCIALVQHANLIANTKKVRSHRAYGRVICKVLGWDLDQLPTSIVSDYKYSELQGNDANANKEVNDLNKITDNENSIGKTDEVTETVDGESMVCEAKDDDNSAVAIVEEEGKQNQVSNEAEGNTEAAANNDEPVKTDRGPTEETAQAVSNE